MQYVQYYSSPLGKITLASDGKSLTGLWFQGQKYYAQTLDQEYIEKDLSIFQDVREWLDSYFRGEIPSIDIPLSPQGSPFRQEVWDILLKIPYGHTMTYGDIAKEIAKKRGLKTMSSQAVGGAVGHNPISIIIPCHRVMGSNHSLTGYAAGIETKRRLLDIENIDYKKS